MTSMQSLRFLVAAATLGLAGFADPGKHFTIDFPKGWSAPTSDADGNAQSDAPSPASVFCRANSVNLASLKGATQPALNSEYSKPLDKPTWAGVFSVDAAKIEISEGQARLVEGRIVQFVTMTLAADVFGAPMKARFVSHILPGHMVNAGCFAPTEAFDAMKPTFEKVVTSLKPL
jgi:hypothetical protein